MTTLGQHFEVGQPENWNDGFASFNAHHFDLPVGVHVTAVGHPEDKFILQRDRLASSPDLVRQYNELKIRFEGCDMDEYRRAKWAFIDQHLATR